MKKETILNRIGRFFKPTPKVDKIKNDVATAIFFLLSDSRYGGIVDEPFILNPSMYTNLSIVKTDRQIKLLITTDRPGIIIGKGGRNITSLENRINEVCENIIKDTQYEKVLVSIDQRKDALTRFKSEYVPRLSMV